MNTDSVQQGARDYKNIYDPLPVEMKVNLQVEKAMRNPTRRSRLGRPPEATSLKIILDRNKGGPTDRIVRKVKSRLKRESDIATQQQLDDVVPVASRRRLIGVEKIKATLAEKDKIAGLAIDAVTERKSPMGRAIQQINKIAKDPEAERLGIQVRADEWESALATVSGRRGAIRATSKGAQKAAQSLAYTRVVKPKIIKKLMEEVKSGNLDTTNPKGYAERLQRIHDNFDELMVKEGANYRELSRRELARRVGQVMKPEIDDAVIKAKNFATSSKALTDTFYENAQMQEAFKQAGITDRKAQFAVKMLMKLGGLG